ncbi:MAG TPA: class I SAM-dependent methyltransferase, partial [Bacillota bacterium]|nr:class I SAM-dependent methyltransferase [Bacillota bacterium]
TGCAVTAIEIGKNLAEFVSCRYAGYPKFRVENISFEEFACEPQTLDLVYSATAFHWIPPEIGYPKAFELLRSGGSIALFWNRPFVNRSNDLLHKEIQSIYMKYRGEVRTQPEYDADKYRSVQDAMCRYGFVDVRLKLYHTTRQFSGDDYVGLLNTYSDHLNMDTSMRLRFEADIKKAIESFGGIVTVYDTIDLHMGRKP